MRPQPKLTAAECVSYLVAASGNSHLAAERAGVPEATLLTTISSDPTAIATLAGQVKVFALLHALEAFKLTHMLYLEKLDDLPATAAARTYTDLIASLGRLGLPQTSQPDTATPMDAVLKLLPPEVADALESYAGALTREPETASPQESDNATLPVTVEPDWEVPPRR